MRVGPRTNTAHISLSGEFIRASARKGNMSDRVYKTSLDILREGRYFALLHSLSLQDMEQRIEFMSGVLVRALHACDDEASLQLLSVLMATITDNAVKDRLVFDERKKVYTLKPAMKAGYSFVVADDEEEVYDHRHDDVARRLISLYTDVPLLAKQRGRRQISQDESEDCELRVGCLEKTKKKIYDIIASCWAEDEDKDLAKSIIVWFYNLPYQHADVTRGNEGRSRDREFALDALRQHAKHRTLRGINSDIWTVLREDKGSPERRENYHYELLSLLAIARMKLLKPNDLVRELKSAIGVG